jgi:DNA-binding response OmpR family regulator
MIREWLVLVVEDDKDSQAYVAEHLAQCGFEVVVASDGDAALRLIHERHPALIFLDMNLPTLSGYDVCEHVRSDPSLAEIRIVMTSAQSSLNVRAFCMEVGADMFVPKPFRLDVVADMIRRIVSGSHDLFSGEP